MVGTKDSINKRKLERHAPESVVNVYDRKSKTFLGRLVDIHREGFLVMGNYSFTENEIYEIDLHRPTAEDADVFISLTVDCLWTRDEDDDRAYWAGCQIIDMSLEAQAAIAQLISPSHSLD